MKTHYAPKYFILLFILGIIWGSSFILMKIGLRTMAPLELAAWRNASALLTSLPFLIPAFKNISYKDWGYIVIAALFGSGIPAILYALASTKIDSSMNGVLNALTPLFTLLFGVYLFKNNSLQNKWLGVIIGFAGATLLILSGNGTRRASDINYLILPVLAAACYGISGNTVKTYLTKYNTFQVTAMLYVFLGIPAFFFLFSAHCFDQLNFAHFQWHFWQPAADEAHQKVASYTAIFILGALGTAVANFGFYFLIKRTSVLFGAMTTYIIPIVALFWGFVAGETISWVHLVSISLICLGIWEVSRTKK